jgi:thiamine-phosphate pyrophosphorylase
VPLIVNDRIEVAVAAGAAGVHLGQTDSSPALARARLGPHAIVGVSIEEVGEIAAVDPGIVDYVAASPVFATTTKHDVKPPLGLGGLRAVRARTHLPLVGIGGIDARNAEEVVAAGADGIAVVSALMGADDPEAAARELRRRMTVMEAVP